MKGCSSLLIVWDLKIKTIMRSPLPSYIKLQTSHIYFLSPALLVFLQSICHCLTYLYFVDLLCLLSIFSPTATSDYKLHENKNFDHLIQRSIFNCLERNVVHSRHWIICWINRLINEDLWLSNSPPKHIPYRNSLTCVHRNMSKAALFAIEGKLEKT